MSKKKRRPQKKIPVPLIAVLVGGVLLIAAVLFFAFSGNGDNRGTPKLEVDQEKIDFGDVKFGVNKTFAIKVTNTGDGTLRFKEKPYIEVLEGC